MKVRDPEYDQEIQVTAGLIRSSIPADLAELFHRTTGIEKDDFRACRPAASGTVCAVDGSHTVVMESGTTALALLRAAQTTFRDLVRVQRSLTPLKCALIGPERESRFFPALYGECFHEQPETPLMNDDTTRAASILMDTLEFMVTEQMSRTLPTGSLLLRDGPLRVSHASHDRVLHRIESGCRERQIGLAGISKRSTATWGGGYPLLLSVHVLAEAWNLPPPWWIRIDPSILDHRSFDQWRHGQTYVATLHSRRKIPLKIELPLDLPEDQVQESMNRLLACSDDGRIPGYPYPLFDAHRSVTLTRDVVNHVRNDLVNGMIAEGIEPQTYDILFGDLHDEFARY